MNRTRWMLLGILVAALGALFVWGCSREGSSGPQTVKVAVTDGGFQPRQFNVREGHPVTLLVTRKTDATCVKELVIEGTDVRRPLPLNQEVAVTITPEKKGELHYSCAMGMVTGTMNVQ
jgi:plastocyanin domain-containing protein